MLSAFLLMASVDPAKLVALAYPGVAVEECAVEVKEPFALIVRATERRSRGELFVVRDGAIAARAVVADVALPEVFYRHTAELEILPRPGASPLAIVRSRKIDGPDAIAYITVSTEAWLGALTQVLRLPQIQEKVGTWEYAEVPDPLHFFVERTLIAWKVEGTRAVVATLASEREDWQADPENDAVRKQRKLVKEKPRTLRFVWDGKIYAGPPSP